jgi:UDP-N-acetylmuramoyl-L-alanyl-D-glutamate--2,6-diaminopimelate ligase
MLLHALLRHFDPRVSVSGIPSSLEVTSVVEDSRRARPGSLFVARSGTKADGAAYVADAKNRGAVAVVTAAKAPGCPLPQVVVADPNPTR